MTVRLGCAAQRSPGVAGVCVAHRELEQVAGVVLDRLQLGAQLRVAVVQHLADGRVHQLVQDNHEHQELAGHERQREVKVENLAGLGEGGRSQQRVASGGGEGGAHGGHLRAIQGLVRTGKVAWNGPAPRAARAHSR